MPGGALPKEWRRIPQGMSIWLWKLQPPLGRRWISVRDHRAERSFGSPPFPSSAASATEEWLWIARETCLSRPATRYFASLRAERLRPLRVAALRDRAAMGGSQ